MQEYPTTISAEWQALLCEIPDPTSLPALPGPRDFKAWKNVQQEVEQAYLALSNTFVERVKPQIITRDINGIPVLDITPCNYQKSSAPILYTHGGAYVFYSACSTLFSSALMAHSTGRRVISVDYTLAPFARWWQITDQVLSVFAGIETEGYPLGNCAFYGDSAGGALAAGAVLKRRDQGLSVPGALVLWSPWSDITETGDSYSTLKQAETAYLYTEHLKPAAAAYADPQEQRHPYISPVYGDYSKGFPPTLIQGGTREIFLSNFIRHYQALDTAGQTVKLDLYEGMPHVFQTRLPESPESQTALQKVAAFLAQYCP